MIIKFAVIAIGFSFITTPALAGFGAIAFSQDSGAYGSSWNYQTRWEAEQRAMKECSMHGYGCKVVMWTRNACAALATSPDDGYGSSWAETKYMAENKALNTCYKYNKSCSILTSFCTQ